MICDRLWWVLFHVAVFWSVVVESAEEEGLWVSQFVGDVWNLYFDSSGKRAIVGSVSNVLGSINLSTSDLNWRQVLSLSSFDILTKMLYDDSSNSIFTLSGENSNIARKWDINDGSIIWQNGNNINNNNNKNKKNSNEKKKKNKFDNNNNNNNNDMLIFGESNLAFVDFNMVYMIYRFDGSVVWSTRIDEANNSSNDNNDNYSVRLARKSRLLIDLTSETIFVSSFDKIENEFSVTSLTLGTVLLLFFVVTLFCFVCVVYPFTMIVVFCLVLCCVVLC